MSLRCRHRSEVASVARGVLSAAALVACAASGETQARTEQPVIGGALDTTHDAVVSIETTLDAGMPELCSGVVIAPRVVLTAGHCTLGQDASTLVVGFGTSAGAPLRTARIASVMTYPAFTGTEDDKAGGLDLGVVVLAKDAGVTPIPIASSGGAVGDPVVVVGFGLSNAGDMQTRGTRRSGATRIVAECSGVISFGDASVGACHGDSGGALLSSGSAGEALLGIVWGGRDYACDPPSYATRIDRMRDWIASVVAAAPSCGAGACPGAATDCRLNDAGADALISLDAAHADAGDAAAEATATELIVVGGGCNAGARRASPFAIAVALLATFIGLRARRRGTSRKSPPESSARARGD